MRRNLIFHKSILLGKGVSFSRYKSFVEIASQQSGNTFLRVVCALQTTFFLEVKMKNKLLTLLTCAAIISSCAFGLSACDADDNNDKLSQLPKPVVTIEDGYAKWQPALGTEKFEISVNRVLYYLENTATDYPLNVDDSFKIRAIGNGVTTSISKWSDEVIYHTFSNDWSYNETHHYKKATCGHPDEVIDMQPHNFVDEICSCGYKTKSEGLEFTLIPNTDEYAVTGIGSYKDTEVIIPSYYNGKAVTRVAKKAFYNNYLITSVTLKDNITYVGEGAFLHCANLKTINVGSNVRDIDLGAFAACQSLTDFNVNSQNLNYADDNGNLYNKSKTTLIQYALGNSAESFKLATTTKKIGNFAFAGSPYLENVNVPINVSSIGYGIFAGCENLNSVSFTNNLVDVEDYTFTYCKNLQSVTLPKNANNVGKYAFYGCEKLININLTNVSGVREMAFYGCKKLKNFTSDNLVTIAKNAFTNCSSLTNITLPSTLTTIESDAFTNCANIEKINFLGSTNEWAKINFGNAYANPVYYSKALHINGTLLERLSINNSVKISNYAFINNYSLISATVYENVEIIGERAFDSCVNIKSITLGNGIRTIDKFAFA